jgi:hypothetical protein
LFLIPVFDSDPKPTLEMDEAMPTEKSKRTWAAAIQGFVLALGICVFLMLTGYLLLGRELMRLVSGAIPVIATGAAIRYFLDKSR